MANTPEGTPYVEASDLVANYPAASLALANRVDLVGVLPFADSAARTTAIPTPTDGQFTYLQDTNSTEFYDGAAFVPLAGGKILQVVRATDTTDRTTTSATPVDAGISVTITPQKSDSAIIVIATGWYRSQSNAVNFARFTITDNSNNSISGAEFHRIGTENFSMSGTGTFEASGAIIGYSTPATTSATTYKLRFSAWVSGQTALIGNANQTGQMYAIEVAA